MTLIWKAKVVVLHKLVEVSPNFVLVVGQIGHIGKVWTLGYFVAQLSNNHLERKSEGRKEKGRLLASELKVRGLGSTLCVAERASHY